MRYSSNRRRLKPTWAKAFKFVETLAGFLINLVALFSELLLRLLSGFIELLGSNQFAFYLFLSTTVFTIVHSVLGFGDVAYVFLRSVGIRQSAELDLGLILFAVVLNFTQLQPRLWKYWSDAAKQEVSTYTLDPEAEKTPVSVWLHAFDYSLKTKNQVSSSSYFVEFLIYALSAITILITGTAGVGTLVLFLLKSVSLLWFPEVSMSMTFAYKTILDRNRKRVRPYPSESVDDDDHLRGRTNSKTYRL